MEYPKHKCFISFKMEDEAYKKAIADGLGKDYFVDKSLKSPIDSENEDYIMRKIRKDYLSDSKVTIFLIGEHSAENTWDDQTYIKRELQGSLYNGEGNTRSGILGVVLPSMYANIYGGQNPVVCEKCGGHHNFVYVNDNTVIKEFSVNYYVPGANKICDAWREEERYCVLVKWDDFKAEPDKYIDAAFQKRSAEIANKVIVYPK